MACKNLSEKFRGCLLGALIGDCLGSRFENETINYKLLEQHIDRAEQGQGKDIVLTDDTQMTQELSKSLLQFKVVNTKDLARRFTERFYKSYNDGERFYGASVINIFKKLKESNYSNPLQPAKEQFNGSGSYGNGAAMRIAPVPLFAYPDLVRTADTAQQTAVLTHTHVHGVHGAVFLAVAIRRCLLTTSDISQPSDFLDPFEADLKQVKICQDYLDSLTVIKRLLSKDNVVDTQVELQLGNSIQALRSVPTSVFIFLHCLRPNHDIDTSNAFRRTLQYAISLGGDTDTIASMACALAGAYYGQAAINTNIIQSCPDSKSAIQLAVQFHSLVQE